MAQQSDNSTSSKKKTKAEIEAEKRAAAAAAKKAAAAKTTSTKTGGSTAGKTTTAAKQGTTAATKSKTATKAKPNQYEKKEAAAERKQEASKPASSTSTESKPAAATSTTTEAKPATATAVVEKPYPQDESGKARVAGTSGPSDTPSQQATKEKRERVKSKVPPVDRMTSRETSRSIQAGTNARGMVADYSEPILDADSRVTGYLRKPKVPPAPSVQLKGIDPKTLIEDRPPDQYAFMPPERAAELQAENEALMRSTKRNQEQTRRGALMGFKADARVGSVPPVRRTPEETWGQNWGRAVEGTIADPRTWNKTVEDMRAAALPIRQAIGTAPPADNKRQPNVTPKQSATSTPATTAAKSGSSTQPTQASGTSASNATQAAPSSGVSESAATMASNYQQEVGRSTSSSSPAGDGVIPTGIKEGGDAGLNEWREAYYDEHGFYPGDGNEESEVDALANKLWSEDFAAKNGRPPSEREWRTHFYREQLGGEGNFDSYWDQARETLDAEYATVQQSASGVTVDANGNPIQSAADTMAGKLPPISPSLDDPMTLSGGSGFGKQTGTFASKVPSPQGQYGTATTGTNVYTPQSTIQGVTGMTGKVPAVSASGAIGQPVHISQTRMRQSPVEGEVYVTQEYGVNPEAYARFGQSGHEGLDIRAREGTRVRPISSGRVVEVGNSPKGWGNYVMVEQEDGTYAVYAHLSKSNVKVGDVVDLDGTIGASGNTGNSTGPHLHISIIDPKAKSGDAHKRGRYVDPTGYWQ